MLADHLVAFDSEIDIFRLDLVEQREYGIATNHLPVKVVWLEGLQLSEAISVIVCDVLLLDERLKLFSLRICRRFVEFFLLALFFIPEHVRVFI